LIADHLVGGGLLYVCGTIGTATHILGAAGAHNRLLLFNEWGILSTPGRSVASLRTHCYRKLSLVAPL